MPDESPKADVPPQPRKRPWWRPHVSTWFLVLLTLAILAVLNVPGSLPQSSAGPNRAGIAHGWPWTMMVRQVIWPDTNDDLAAFLWSWSVQPASDAALAQSRTFVIRPQPPTGRTYYPAA